MLKFTAVKFQEQSEQVQKIYISSSDILESHTDVSINRVTYWYVCTINIRHLRKEKKNVYSTHAIA